MSEGKKVWEETDWIVSHHMTIIGGTDTLNTERAFLRARLAAQAPAMARLLLDAEWVDGSGDEYSPVCPWCHQNRENRYGCTGPTGHAPDCRWLAVLRAAGVRE